jgi:hypothetical protein
MAFAMISERGGLYAGILVLALAALLSTVAIEVMALWMRRGTRHE